MEVIVQEIVARMSRAAPAGFVLAFGVGTVSAGHVFQAYPKAWHETYDRDGLLVKDPTVAWGMRNTGAVRWSELHASDPEGVFDLAAAHGLHYGASVSLLIDGVKNFAGFARADREMSDAEIEECMSGLSTLYALGERIGFSNMHRDLIAAKPA